MHETTKELLRACSRIDWHYTSGSLAEAVRAWQNAGCPDKPEAKLNTIIRQMLMEMEDLKERLEKGDTTKSEANEELLEIIQKARKYMSKIARRSM